MTSAVLKHTHRIAIKERADDEATVIVFKDQEVHMTGMINVERFTNLFPPFEDDEARAALVLYRLLAQAKPVSVASLAESSGLTACRIENFLRASPAVFRDSDGLVTGFMGLGLRPTAYRLHVGGNEVYPWCAWDTLFLPELLGAVTDVTATSGIDKRPVQLRVSGGSARTVTENLYVSFPGNLDDTWTRNVLVNFCHHVFFLLEDEVGRWLEMHPNTPVLDLHEAFDLGARRNRRLFGRALYSTATAMI